MQEFLEKIIGVFTMTSIVDICTSTLKCNKIIKFVMGIIIVSAIFDSVFSINMKILG